MDDNASRDVLQNIKRYAIKVRDQHRGAMDIEGQNSDAIAARLTSTVNELQARLEQRRAELQALRRQVPSSLSTIPSMDPRERLRQLRTITKAYELMTPEQPNLPEPNSAVQPLLAARIIQKTIKDTKADIATAQSRLDSATQQLAKEEAQLAESKAITKALETRTARLQAQQREELTKTDAEKAQDLLKAKTERKRKFEKDTQKLQQVLDDFIDEQLAAMLAAEEIGGPVVGDLMDVDEDMLTAGFSATGKRKTSSRQMSDDKRQRRIDDIWGASGAGTERGDIEHETEKDAAAAEMRALLDELMQSGGYVTLSRDSAVARFLVRCKVAQFHPKDAMRLRLIDFARELDD